MNTGKVRSEFVFYRRSKSIVPSFEKKMERCSVFYKYIIYTVSVLRIPCVSIIHRFQVDFPDFFFGKYFRVVLDAGKRNLEGVAGHPVHVFGFYTFRGTGMYGFLEPFSMNYAGGQGPIEKGGGQWFFHSATGAPEQEVEALRGVQILSSAPEGMYFYRAPTIYFADREGRVYPFMEAAETLTDLLCWRSWLFVTYLGPFEEHTEKNGAAAYRDRSYVVVYDRASGGAAAILERCAGVFYIDENVAVLCDLLDGGEIRRNVYKVPVRGWTEEGLKALANYGGRIRGSTAFSRLLFDACGADNHWKNAAECTADLRCCDWKRKRLGYQKKGVLIWRAFSGAPLSGGDPL